MQSRRDQVQAYFFVVSRMIAAVTHGRPDALVQPNRRTSSGITVGVLLAAVIAGIFGIYGLFVPGGNQSWRTPGVVIAAEETGARYLFLDGQLRPVLNYTSARLAGAAGTPVRSVSTSSLEGTPIGRPIGIRDAPDGIPAAADLDTGAWTVCTGESARGVPGVTVLIGRGPGRPLGDDQGLLVTDPEGERHLVWQGRRHLIPDATTVQVLGYGDTDPLPVPFSWLEPVPAGRDLGVPPTAGAGDDGPVIGGVRTLVGQVLAVRNPALGTEELYLLREDGVAPVSGTAAALLLASPATADAYPDGSPTPIPVGPAALAGVPVSAGADLATGLPAVPPAAAAAPGSAVPCARYTPDADGVTTTIELQSRTDVDSAAGTGVREVGTIADRVSVPVGAGVLVRDEGAAAAGTFLVTDSGTRYPVAGDDALSALGYGGAPVVALPGPLLDLLPTGPLLSTTAARSDAGI